MRLRAASRQSARQPHRPQPHFGRAGSGGADLPRRFAPSSVTAGFLGHGPQNMDHRLLSRREEEPLCIPAALQQPATAHMICLPQATMPVTLDVLAFTATLSCLYPTLPIARQTVLAASLLAPRLNTSSAGACTTQGATAAAAEARAWRTAAAGDGTQQANDMATRRSSYSPSYVFGRVGTSLRVTTAACHRHIHLS